MQAPTKKLKKAFRKVIREDNDNKESQIQEPIQTGPALSFRSTISIDNTAGAQARDATLLYGFARKTRPLGTRTLGDQMLRNRTEEIQSTSNASDEPNKSEPEELEGHQSKTSKEDKEIIPDNHDTGLSSELRNAGLDDKQIQVVLELNRRGVLSEANANRPTYTRMARRHLSIETLNRYRIDYEIDRDPDYVLIKRWVPEYEQDFLWGHTKEVREKRAGLR